jgi:hypothetical protein
VIKFNVRYTLAFVFSVGVGSQLPKIATALLFGRESPPAGGVTGAEALPKALPKALPAEAVTLTGSIDLATVPQTALPSDKWTSAVAVLMSASEWRSCEDIGRQLRELRREASARGVPLVFWTDQKSFEAVATELRRERLSGIRLIALDNLGRRIDGRTIVTPAVVHFDSNGRLIAGVSYPSRHPNVRPVPFAAEIWPPKR